MTAPPLQAALYILAAILLAYGIHLAIWVRLVWRLELSLTQRRIAGWLLVAGGLLFPVGMLQLLLMRHIPRLIAGPLMTTAFTWLGVVICLVWGVAAFELSRVVFRPAKRMQVFLARATLAVAMGMSALGVMLANTQPAIVTTPFDVAGKLPPYRIVQVSDLHIGPTLGRAFAARLAETVNALHPDLIVVTGDMVDGSVRELEAEVAPLKALVAREGIVFVPGNHEYLSGIQPWLEHVESFGWRVLRNARVSLTDLDVVGLEDSWESSKAPEGLLVRSAHRPLLVVAHQPQAFPDACRAGVDLALAGHTHGGQIFPFGIWERLQQGYLQGAYSCGPTQLYVSSGAGYWGPPMRLGSRNEISVLELTGK
jgi:predicted MPP superfamily phosphohydrolase